MTERSKTMPCRLCGASANHTYTAPLLGYDVAYYRCSECNYFQTEKPYWLDEAYGDAINDSDTGILVRNLDNAHRVIATLVSLNSLNGTVLDYAGGYGILVRLLRDFGVDAYWADKHCKNLLAKGFEHDDRQYNLVTAFEVFEHLEHPVQELNNLLGFAEHVLISTELFSDPEGPNKTWWYRAPEHGQHIGFFDRQSLSWLARQCNCYHVSIGTSLHLFSKSPIPLRWKWLTRYSKLTAAITRLKLTPRTQQDFEKIRHEDRI